MFLNDMDSKLVSMGVQDEMYLYNSYIYTGGEVINFVIKNDGIYYFSETQFQPKSNVELVINSVGAKKWATWDPTANPQSFDYGDVLPPLKVTFETRTFENVEAVGIAFDFRRNQYSMDFAFNEFVVTTTSGAPKGTLLIIK